MTNVLTLEQCNEALSSPDSDTWTKYNALFCLRTIGTDEASEVLIAHYDKMGESELLKHETMYVMGQMRVSSSYKFLVDKMNDPEEYPIVRHEAGEGLANYHNIKDQCIEEMQKHWDSEISVLKSTVRVGIEKLKNFTSESRYGKKYGGTIEPAEPFNEEELTEYLNMTMLDGSQNENLPLLERVHKKLLLPYSLVDEYPKYRMCYFLRDTCTKESKLILGNMLAPENREFISPLLRHEIAFILGQIFCGEQELREILQATCYDETENPVVRHEAILAFYEIAQD
jgi:deoxyhypusine monooxygenase